MKNLKNKGGKREGAGAPKKEHPAKSRTIRLTDEQWAKLQSLGGANWIRWVLDHTTDIK